MFVHRLPPLFSSSEPLSLGNRVDVSLGGHPVSIQKSSVKNSQKAGRAAIKIVLMEI
jgi:hypothetical protein